jgi:hypothetical protein
MDSWRAMAAGKVIPINCSSRVHLGLCSVSLRSPKYVGTAKPKLAFAGYFHPEPSLAWVGLWWFMLLAFTATIVEFFGDKVPALDHALHTLHMARSNRFSRMARGRISGLRIYCDNAIRVTASSLGATVADSVRRLLKSGARLFHMKLMQKKIAPLKRL